MTFQYGLQPVLIQRILNHFRGQTEKQVLLRPQKCSVLYGVQSAKKINKNFPQVFNTIPKPYSV